MRCVDLSIRLGACQEFCTRLWFRFNHLLFLPDHWGSNPLFDYIWLIYIIYNSFLVGWFNHQNLQEPCRNHSPWGLIRNDAPAPGMLLNSKDLVFRPYKHNASNKWILYFWFQDSTCSCSNILPKVIEKFDTTKYAEMILYLQKRDFRTEGLEANFCLFPLKIDVLWIFQRLLRTSHVGVRKYIWNVPLSYGFHDFCLVIGEVWGLCHSAKKLKDTERLRVLPGSTDKATGPTNGLCQKERTKTKWIHVVVGWRSVVGVIINNHVSSPSSPPPPWSSSSPSPTPPPPPPPPSSSSSSSSSWSSSLCNYCFLDVVFSPFSPFKFLYPRGTTGAYGQGTCLCLRYRLGCRTCTSVIWHLLAGESSWRLSEGPVISGQSWGCLLRGWETLKFAVGKCNHFFSGAKTWKTHTLCWKVFFDFLVKPLGHTSLVSLRR